MEKERAIFTKAKLIKKERARQGTSNIGADGVDNYDEARSGEVTQYCDVISSKLNW